MSSVVLDASAVLALINGEPGAEVVEAMLGDAAISSVNFAEVVSKLTEDGVAEEVIYDGMRKLTLEVVPFDMEQAYTTGFLREPTRQLGLSLGDRGCLSLARKLELPVLTTDRNWAKLSVEVEVRLVR